MRENLKQRTHVSLKIRRKLHTFMLLLANLCRGKTLVAYTVLTNSGVQFDSNLKIHRQTIVSICALTPVLLQNVTLPHKSSMLMGVLMLCGIKPAVLNLYNTMMGYFTAASEDFAIFFFSFMMANMVMS